MATNAMNDTVAELRSRPYQLANVRSATSQNGSTVVDDDSRKSDYKRIVNNNTGSASGQTGGTQTTIVSIPFVLFENLYRMMSSRNGVKYALMDPNYLFYGRICAK
jgi:hypothetical protein